MSSAESPAGVPTISEIDGDCPRRRTTKDDLTIFGLLAPNSCCYMRKRSKVYGSNHLKNNSTSHRGFEPKYLQSDYWPSDSLAPRLPNFYANRLASRRGAVQIDSTSRRPLFFSVVVASGDVSIADLNFGAPKPESEELLCRTLPKHH